VRALPAGKFLRAGHYHPEPYCMDILLDNLRDLIDFVLHIDRHLDVIVRNYQSGTYAILFAIIFAETGLVVTPILPGDSLLFAAGAMAALGSLNVVVLMILLIIAAILGDAVNYAVGSYIGTRIFKDDARIFKTRYLEMTQRFYEKHGARTIVIARFVPIVRTFAPFVAGASRMRYTKFAAYNIAGGVLWIVSLTLAGYLFGNIPLVRDNFGIVVILIILVSVMAPVAGWYRDRRRTAAAATPDERVI
jgi:membrane-associated protein